jgi:hypothetical protein
MVFARRRDGPALRHTNIPHAWISLKEEWPFYEELWLSAISLILKFVAYELE